MRAYVLWLPVVLIACAPDDPRPAAQSATTEVSADSVPRVHQCGEGFDRACSATAACVDADGDGFGENCPSGVDCDDEDPTVRDECVRCATPSDACPCASGTAPMACDADTNGPVTPITCWIGQRNCVAGQWSHCTPFHPRFR